MIHIPGISFPQVTNASLILKLLADTDFQSFRALQEEVDVLEGRLSECEREKEQEQSSRYPGPPLSSGEFTDSPRFCFSIDWAKCMIAIVA